MTSSTSGLGRETLTFERHRQRVEVQVQNLDLGSGEDIESPFSCSLYAREEGTENRPFLERDYLNIYVNLESPVSRSLLTRDR